MVFLHRRKKAHRVAVVCYQKSKKGLLLCVADSAGVLHMRALPEASHHVLIRRDAVRQRARQRGD
jgi:hypothetical protein